MNSLPQFGLDRGCPDYYGHRYIGGSMFAIKIDQCWAEMYPDEAPDVQHTPCGQPNFHDSLGLCPKHRELLCET